MAQSKASSLSDQASGGGPESLVEGSLWRAIWSMSWPLLLTTTSASLIGLVDMQVAGTLGSTQQAAVGVSEQILFLFMIFIMCIGVGTTAMVSRAWGAGNKGEALESAAQSISLSFGMGVVLCVLSVSCAKFGLRLFSEAPDVVAIATRYLGIYSLFLLPFSIVSIINASYRAIGDTKTPLMIVGCMTVLNIAGDYLTVLHNWPVPGLGLTGIAISGMAASWFGSALGICFIMRSPLQGCLKRLLPVYLPYIKRILHIGIPSAFQRLGWSLSVFVLFFILTRCGHPTQAIASWTIGMRVEGLIFMPLMALSLAVSSIVGQNLGAQQVDRAVGAGWKTAWMGIGMMTVMGACLVIFAPFLAQVMSKDPQTIEFVTGYLRINGLSEPFLALGMILSGALQGAGDTRTPMWITLVCHWIIRLPLAWLLAVHYHWGPNGAWAAMASSVVVSGFLCVWRFQSKGWVKTKV
jgi:putative MATE family efflux protein